MGDDKLDNLRRLYLLAAEQCSGWFLALAFVKASGYLIACTGFFGSQCPPTHLADLALHSVQLNMDVQRWLSEAGGKLDEPARDSAVLAGCLRRTFQAYREMLTYSPEWAGNLYVILREGFSDGLDVVDALAGIADDVKPREV